MARARHVNIAKPVRKRSATTGTLVGVRLQDDELKAVDNWATKQEPPVTRPFAIRRLVELGLTVKTKGGPPKSEGARQGTKQRARELANVTIDEMTDTTASSENQANRRRQLISGPEEFQKVRRDRSK